MRTIPIQVTDAEFIPTSWTNPLSLTISNLSNGLHPFEPAEKYALITLRTGSQVESYFYFNFDPQIPSDATNISVTCYARASCPITTGVNTCRIQLYSGDTAKGTAATLGSSSAAITTTDLAANTSWTASEINNARLYFYAKRGTSYTDQERQFRMYGATLTVTYTYNQTQYEVTWTNHISLNTASVNGGTASSTGTAYVNAGEQMVFTIYKNNSPTFVAGLTSHTYGQEEYSIVGLTNPGSNMYRYTEPDGISRDITFDIFEPCYINVVNLLSTLITNIQSTAYQTFQSDQFCVRSGQGTHILIYGSGLTTFNTNPYGMFTDNDQNRKTSIGYDSGYTEGQYVMNNITGNHTLVFFAATRVDYSVDSHVASNTITANTVSATSQYGNYCEDKGTVAPYGKYYYVFPDSTVTVSWNGDLTHCSLTNNGTNVKSSASYTTSSGSYTFSINNPLNYYNISIIRNAIITCDSEVTNAYFLGDGNGSYSYTKDVAPGSNYNVYINYIPVSNSWETKDNNTTVTSSLVSDTVQYQGNTVSCWRLTLSTLSADHEIEVLNVQVAGNKIFIKIGGQWKEALNVFCKVGGAWYPINKVWKKSSGAWQEQSDISAMFTQQNTLYLKP